MARQPIDPAVSSEENTWRERGSRAALIVGFGTLLLFMAFVGINSLRGLRTFEANNARIRQTFLYREHTLGQIRAGLYDSANIASEYIVNDLDAKAQDRLGTELKSVRSDTMAALTACIQSLPVDEAEPFQHLAMGLEQYWATIDALVALEASQKDGGRTSELRNALLSRNAEVLAITQDISAANNEELKEDERSSAEASAQFRRRLLVATASGLCLGLILAATTILYAGHLERIVKHKYQEILHAHRESRELSKRLVNSEERERRNISRELHDGIGQSLGALLLEITNATEMPIDEPLFRKRMQNIKAEAEICLNEVRDMALLLRPSMLDDLGLVPALEWQAREVSKRTGMLVDTQEENVSDDLPDEYRTCVYRIVQEALNNCVKHACARMARIVVRQDPGHLWVSIEDDGKGFDTSRVRGLGLVGMKERVTQLGGTFTVDSDSVRGTRLAVDLPLPYRREQREAS